MNDNPFNSDNFVSIWLKHFKPNKKTYTFKSILNVRFYRSKYFNLFFDVGKNITNGIYYSVNNDGQDYKGKTFLIYDVPDYFEIKNTAQKHFKTKRVKQYRGATANLKGFCSFETYFSSVFKSNSRSKHKRNIKRLEACFDVSYKVFYGTMEKDEYDTVFNKLMANIEKRFNEKGVDNRILAQKAYYYDLIYPMVLDKKAVIDVIYSNDIPVAVSVGFLSKNILYYAITSFDTDYYRFNLGHITIIKLLQWCFDNNFDRFDFSKGLVDYKERWTNHRYTYEYHILYDPKSVVSIIMSSVLYAFFGFKQFLRDRKVNHLYSKIKYVLKHKQGKTEHLMINAEELHLNNIDVDKLNQVDINNKNYSFLKAPLFDYLYKNPENIKFIKVFKETDNIYYALGEKTSLRLSCPDIIA